MGDGEAPMASPDTCLQNVSPKVKMLFRMISLSADMMASFGSLRCWYLFCNIVVMTWMAGSVGMFVYIAVASQVKSLALGGSGSPVNRCLSSNEFLRYDCCSWAIC